jgi:hypothetical protein
MCFTNAIGLSLGIIPAAREPCVEKSVKSVHPLEKGFARAGATRSTPSVAKLSGDGLRVRQRTEGATYGRCAAQKRCVALGGRHRKPLTLTDDRDRPNVTATCASCRRRPRTGGSPNTRTTRGHLGCYGTSKRRTEFRLTFRRLAISLLLTPSFCEARYLEARSTRPKHPRSHLHRRALARAKGGNALAH